MASVSFSLGATNPQLGLGVAIYSRRATPYERTYMPMHAITLLPSDMTVARQVLASHHATRGSVKLFSLLTIFRRITLAIYRLLNRS